jgi:hypothetical protein
LGPAPEARTHRVWRAALQRMNDKSAPQATKNGAINKSQVSFRRPCQAIACRLRVSHSQPQRAARPLAHKQQTLRTSKKKLLQNIREVVSEPIRDHPYNACSTSRVFTASTELTDCKSPVHGNERCFTQAYFLHPYGTPNI